jgi:hypothetical protein
MSPVAVPVGTAVTAVPAMEDSNVVAVPTWVMVAVVVAAVVDSTKGAALMAVATTRRPIEAPMTLFHQSESARCPRRPRLCPRRGPAPPMLLCWFEPLCGPAPLCADMDISLAAIEATSAAHEPSVPMSGGVRLLRLFTWSVGNYRG